MYTYPVPEIIELLNIHASFTSVSKHVKMFSYCFYININAFNNCMVMVESILFVATKYFSC